jgi:transcription antitermination factor NusG
VQVFRCSVEEAHRKKRKEMGEEKKNRVYNRTTRERNDMYVYVYVKMSKRKDPFAKTVLY